MTAKEILQSEYEHQVEKRDEALAAFMQAEIGEDRIEYAEYLAEIARLNTIEHIACNLGIVLKLKGDPEI